MSIADLPERPAFNSLEPGLEEMQAAPVSRLAVVAISLGVLSLFSALSTSILPLAMVAAAFSAVVIWKLSRDPSASGLRLAQAGLAFAILGAAWVISATMTRNAYLYNSALPHAQTFLKVISDGNPYQAFELTKPERARQLSGTDLKAFYENTDDYLAKDQIETFIKSASVKEIMSRGAGAKWELIQGESVEGHTTYRIKLLMADSTQPEKKKIQVIMTRELLPAPPGSVPTAAWLVNETLLAKE
jgi:hypothetical protein